jgi:hypothetical protein
MASGRIFASGVPRPRRRVKEEKWVFPIPRKASRNLLGQHQKAEKTISLWQANRDEIISEREAPGEVRAINASNQIDPCAIIRPST